MRYRPWNISGKANTRLLRGGPPPGTVPLPQVLRLLKTAIQNLGGGALWRGSPGDRKRSRDGSPSQGLSISCQPPTKTCCDGKRSRDTPCPSPGDETPLPVRPRIPAPATPDSALRIRIGIRGPKCPSLRYRFPIPRRTHVPGPALQSPPASFGGQSALQDRIGSPKRRQPAGACTPAGHSNPGFSSPAAGAEGCVPGPG